MTALRVALIMGTRPEAIKLLPVYLAMKADARIAPVLVATAQHRQMLDQVCEAFGVWPDVDLDLMTPGQGLPDLAARVIVKVNEVLEKLRADVVVVQGDTSTALYGALAAFYARIPVAHVEAGLRTYDYNAPWPEEMNRRLCDPISQWCFAPTEGAAENLRSEGIAPARIHVTGNTVVDALLMTRQRVLKQAPEIPGLSLSALEGRRLILVTGHRRESFGAPFEALCFGLRDIVRAHPDAALVYPVHLNPNVQAPVRAILGSEERVHLIPPVEYLPFVYLMERSHFIITDSGGIQEEAPALRKPVLVTRDTTERPEAVELGLAKLVGTDRQQIARAASLLLSDSDAYAQMATGASPYGDGTASQQIVALLAA